MLASHETFRRVRNRRRTLYIVIVTSGGEADGGGETELTKNTIARRDLLDIKLPLKIHGV